MGLFDSDNIEEIPGTGIGEEDSLLGKIRRYSALTGMEDPEEAPADSRVDDEKHGASGGPAGPDATAASINPSSATLPDSAFTDAPRGSQPAPAAPAAAPGGYQDDPQEKAHLADLVAQRQALLNPAPKPSLKHRILAAIVQAAPTAIAAGVGGAPAASGAASGTMNTIENQRADKALAETRRNQQAQTLGQQIEAERGRQETQRFSAGQQQRQQTNQQALAKANQDHQDERDAVKESAAQELEQIKQVHTDERDDKRFKETNAALDKRMADSDKRQAAGFENSNKMQDKRLAQQMAMMNKKEADKADTYTPQAQKILMQTEPVKQSLQRILDRLEPYKNDNKPFSSLVGRIKYAAGMGSPTDKEASDISDMLGAISMTGIQGSARILAGSSRAFQALQLGMQHMPNPWTDSKHKMYEQLTSVMQNLVDTEEDAKRYGAKSGRIPTDTNTPRQPGGRTAPTAAPAAAGGGKVLVEGRDF